MLEQEIQKFAKKKGLHPHTVERWCNWAAEDGAALLSLSLAVTPGENHLRELMDWLEEIEIRDALSIRDVLQSQEHIVTDPRLGRADRLKRIKEQIRRIRFPRLAQLEDSIRTRIKELRLPPGIKVSLPPGLEGGHLRFEFTVTNPDGLKTIVGKLSEVSESPSVAKIFSLLKGDLENGGREAAD
jgi:hypothetical protein